MAHGVGGAEDDVLDLVVDPATGLEGLALRVSGEVVQVRLEEPECLDAGREKSALRTTGNGGPMPGRGTGEH